jgi:hypothetical protein
VHVDLAIRVFLGRFVLGLGMRVLSRLGVFAFALMFIGVRARATIRSGAGMLIAVLMRLPHAAFTGCKESEAGHFP